LIVDQIETKAADERVERSARLRWVGGEFRLRIEVPAGFEPSEEDATAFLLVALPLALYRGEDLQVNGLVSAQTLRQTERIQAIYAAWDPVVRRCRVRVTGETPIRPAADGQGCLFSRGVDSMHSATSADSEPLTHLVFCDTLEPIQDAPTRAREWRLVAEAAELVGLPVLRISTNLRDPGAQLIDYQVMHGAGIAFMAHSLSTGLGRVVVPADLTYSVAGPSGSHPLLDSLFGSEWLALDYRGLELGRTGKVRQLATTRPELLPYLKTCYTKNTHANCGECFKCLMTMMSLQAVGVLKDASLFPDEVDVDSLRKVRIEDLPQRLTWMQAAESLGDTPEDRCVREAAHHVLRRSALPTLPERFRGAREWIRGERQDADLSWSASPSSYYRNETNVAVALLRKGRPFPYGIEAATPQPVPAWSVGQLEPDWGPPLENSSVRVGLLRLLDRQDRRHRYAIGIVPPLAGVERVGELGALLRERGEDGIAVWLTADGRLCTERYEPSPPELDARVLTRWTLAPIRWTDVAPLADRVREVVRRGVDAAGALRGANTGPGEPKGARAGYLLASEGNGHVPLFSSIHPVSGDQLLSTDQGESTKLGYNAPMLLGFLMAEAPASGALGLSRPLVPWASRFGR
jgi:hypothetical protein